MFGICLPFHYQFRAGEPCSEIKADVNVTVWKWFIRDGERYAPVLPNLCEIRASGGDFRGSCQVC